LGLPALEDLFLPYTRFLSLFLQQKNPSQMIGLQLETQQKSSYPKGISQKHFKENEKSTV
jgi:hypothetical protein